MPEFTNHQLLLMRLRDDRCNKKAAELARKIGKDATYVSRLFYPIGKKGGKGVGLEIMTACTKAFDLPAGYWDGAVDLPANYKIDRDSHSNGHEPANESGVIQLPTQRVDRWTAEAMDILSKLNEAQRAACVVQLRAYAAAVGPPRDGQALSVADQKKGAA
ncbi:hypothetical protein [Rhodoferax ferrireducens]|uniref:hypothetical protein n=1 Tax=Rhodoferax ferrireducens TaxID=192843 RepID=UPI000E0D1BAA|nr:hypothetical protein [Rhodoferax ferrireducens]